MASTDISRRISIAKRIEAAKAEEEKKKASSASSTSGTTRYSLPTVRDTLNQTTTQRAQNLQQQNTVLSSANPFLSTNAIPATATADEKYERLASGLASGDKLLASAQEELDQMRSTYATSPLQTWTDAYDQRMAAFQNNLKTYNDMVEQYNYYNTAAGIKERADALLTKRDAAQSAYTQARKDNPMIQGQRDNAAAVDAAKAEYDKYSSSYQNLINLYYQVENQEKQEGLQSDAALSGQYSTAQELQEDMDRVTALMAYTTDKTGDAAAAEEARQYLMDKYGLDQKAIDQYAISGTSYVSRADGGYASLYELYQELQEKQKAAVETLAGAGYDYARMAEYEQMQRDAAAYAEKTAAWESYAREHPILSSLDSVLVSPFQGVDYLKTMAGGIGSSDTRDLENYVPLNVYNMDATNMVNTVRGTIASDLEESTDWEILGQNVASFLYQTGMSIADSTVQVAALGNGATLLMGASAASSQAKAIIEKGGTNAQAFWGGLAAGAAETIFEKFSIDRLLSPKSVTSVKSLLAETLKQAGTEASEEVLTEVSNILSDAIIMGQNSDFNLAVEQYKLIGFSEEEAKQQALLDCIGQVAWAGVGGALSGAAMGGTVNSINLGASSQATRAQGKAFQQMGDDVVQAILQEGLDSDPSTKSYQLAAELQSRQGQGKTVSGKDLGRLYQENVKTVEAEQAAQENARAVIRETLEQAREQMQPQLYDMADQLQQKADRGETITQEEIAQLEQARALLIGAETAQTEQTAQATTGTETGAENGLEGASGQNKTASTGETETSMQTDRSAQTPNTPGNLIFQNEESPVSTSDGTSALSGDLDTAADPGDSGTRIPQQEPGVQSQSAQDAEEYLTPTELKQREELPTERTVQNNEQAGENVSDGGQGRISGPGAGEQAGGVAAGAKRTGQTSEQLRTAVERQNRVQALRGERVSSLDLGVEQGTDEKTVRIAPEEVWDDAMQATAERIFAETGKEVTYVIGGLPLDTPGGTATVRGVYSQDGIIVQADHMKLNIDQIADHEIFHDKAFQTPGLVRELEERIVERFGREDFERVVDTYVEHLRGVIDIPENASQDEIDAAMLKIYEEIMADAYAGINFFGAHAERYNETVEQGMEERGAGRSQENAAATERTTGPPEERYSADDRKRRQQEADSSLHDNSVRATMEQNSQGGADNGRTREETAADFKRRAVSGGYTIYEVEDGKLYGYRRLAEGQSARKNAGQVQEELKALGIDADIIADNVLLCNKNGITTTRTVPQAATVDREHIFVSNGASVPPRNAAGHEAFHLWKNGTERDAYISVIEDNLLFNSEAFHTYQSTIAQAYLGGEADLTDLRRREKLFEELFAYISGDIHEGTNGELLSPMFRDYDAVTRAWEQLVQANRGTDALDSETDSVEHGDNQAPTSSPDARYSVDDETADDLKQSQWEIIRESNPMQDDYHTGIRSAEEIKTYSETLNDEEWLLYDGFSPDYTWNMAQDAEASGTIKVYSSYPIANGVFVTPSRMEAQDYAGGGKVYEKTVKLTDVAWIDPTQGQYARVQESPRAAWEGTQRFSVDDDGQRKKPVAESKPIIAKNDLRGTLLSLFSIPGGAKAELGRVIDQYADRLLKNGALTEDDRTAFFDRMYNSGLVEVAADEYASQGRRRVRGGRIYVNDAVRQEFGDDWNAFRRQAFNAGVYLTGNTDDMGVDVWNAELAEDLPGMFRADDLDNRDILERIVRIAEEGKGENMSLPDYISSVIGEEFISEQEALDNIERQFDWALRTFAEKANLEIKLRDRTGVKIARERERAAQSRSRQRERERERETLRRGLERRKRQETVQRQRENRQLREMQQKTLKQLQWLSKNQWRAPEELRRAFDDVLGDLDIYAVGAANAMNWSKKYQATWGDLAQMYKDAQASDPNFLPSKELEQKVARLDNSKIADLDLGALQTLYQAAVGLRTEFYNRNNMIGQEQNAMIAEVYEGSKEELESSARKHDTTADTLFNQWQLTPMNRLERMAGWNPDSAWYGMARQLEEGERAARRFEVEAKRTLQNFLTEHADWVKIADGQGKDAIWYEVEVPELLELHMGDKPIFGDTVTVSMTPAQKVHLYLESRNYDNLRHMTGGRTFADKELYSQGKRTEAFAQGTTIRLAPETVKKLVADLTEEERALADALDQYYNGYATGEINRVSNILYGYDKAMGGNYAPIYTNQNYTKSEPGIFDVTAEGVGNLKSRVYSKNPSYNIGAFDAFERSISKTKRFVGMSIPIRNWNGLMNWRTANNSMADVVTHTWGEQGKRFIDDLLTELQEGLDNTKDDVEKLSDKLLSKYVSSVFGFNPSIVFKQAASFPLAATYLDWQNAPNIAKALRVDDTLINTYTGELAYRLLGYSSPETAQLKNHPSKLQENGVLNFVFGGGAITAMDGWTVKTMWSWAQNKVLREQTDLEMGTQEQIARGESPFYKAVAREFEEAVSRSQPMYDIMHRSDIMRKSNAVARTFTMFKTVPQQEYNMLRQAVGEAQALKKSGADLKTQRKAARKAGRAFANILIGNLMIGTITFLNAMLKNRAKKYRDDDGELTAESVMAQFGMQLLSDNAGVVLFGDTACDALGAMLMGETWYDLETPGVSQLSDIISGGIAAYQTVSDFLSGAIEAGTTEASLGQYFEDNSNVLLGAVDDVTETLATYMGGLPAANVKGYLLGLLQNVSPSLYTEYEDFMETADKSGLKGLTGDALVTRVGNILDDRAGGAEDATVETLAALYEAGYTDAAPAAQTDSVTIDGEERKFNIAQQQTYKNIWSEAVGGVIDDVAASEDFRNADEKTQEKILRKLYSYADQTAKRALFDDFDADTWIDEAAQADDLADWVIWQVRSGSSETFDKLADAGMDNDTALEVVEAFSDLEALDGHSSVILMQKYEAIADAPLSDEEKEISLSIVSESNYAKYEAAREYVGIDAYLEYLVAVAQRKEDGLTTKQEDVEELLDSMDLTNSERAALWQAAGKTWKAANNPYDEVIGQEIYDVLNAE